MTTRPTRVDTLKAIARVIAERGTCDRKYAGAVIAKDGRPISWGFNGAPPGLPHCEENNHGYDGVFPGPQSVAIREASHALSNNGCRNATHAEANAIAFAARQGISTEGAELYVTLAPCDVCARLIIAAGIVLVEYEEPYRDRTGVELLEQVGIGVYCSI